MANGMKQNVLIFVVLTLIFSFTNRALAHDSHQSTPNIYNSQGVALGIAMSQISPSINTNKFQVGVGFGSFGNGSAFAVGIAKRVTSKILLGAKIGSEDGRIGIGLGLNFKF